MADMEFDADPSDETELYLSREPDGLADKEMAVRYVLRFDVAQDHTQLADLPLVGLAV